MTWLTAGVAIIGISLAFRMWHNGYLQGVKWVTQFYINNEELGDLLEEYLQGAIPPDIKARMEALRNQAQPQKGGVREEFEKELAKIKLERENGNATEERQPEP